MPGGRANDGIPILAILVAGQTLPEIAARRGDFERFIRTRAGGFFRAGERDGKLEGERASEGERAGAGAGAGRGSARGMRAGMPAVRWVTYDVRGAAPLPGPRDADAFLMTGSSSSVTERAPWMLRAEELLRQIVAARAPFLGICFGHQMIAQALGGEVTRNPRGREIGTVRLTRTGDDPLFAGLPRAFDVHETHVDSVTRLPPGAEVLATTALDPAAAFRVGPLVHGVQFHPELDADIARGYVTARAKAIVDEGGDPGAILAGIHDGTRGHDVLRNFVRGLRYSA